MLGGIVNLISYGLGAGGTGGAGGTAGSFLFQLEQQGVFSYILPFLMIFAVLFGILTKIKIFGENKGINIILALSVALMSLQLNFVSYFFREIFPRMGVMLAIVLVTIVLLGLFFDFKKSKLVKWIMGILVTIGLVIIIGQSLDIFSWLGFGMSGGTFWYIVRQNVGKIVSGVIIVGGLIAIIVSGKKESEKDSKNSFARLVNSMAAMDD